jgi:putative flavoprotein involved in K+ transport
MTERIETVVIGAGQAGLAMSYWLSRARRPHVVLERAPYVANAWRNERWESFTLVTPNFQVRMPGAEYAGPEPFGFMSRGQIVAYLDAYAERFHLPVRCDVEAISVDAADEQLCVGTGSGSYHCQNVVVATGLYRSPKIPHFSRGLPSTIRQLHSMQYRSPNGLPSGAVLIVGTGQSGAQIAKELYESGRQVYLSVGGAGRVPRRYRGRDINDWLTQLGMFDTKVRELKSPAAKFTAHPQMSGSHGGETLNLHQFARDGVRLLGRVRDVADGNLVIAPDLYETLARVDEFEVDALRRIDDYIARMGIEAPRETVPHLRDGFAQAVITELDLRAHDVTTVLWATGYACDFSFVRLPVVDSDHYPIQTRGVTRYDGLYFLGMPWLHSKRSGLLFGVGDDAAFLAEQIGARARAEYARASSVAAGE